MLKAPALTVRMGVPMHTYTPPTSTGPSMGCLESLRMCCPC